MSQAGEKMSVLVSFPEGETLEAKIEYLQKHISSYPDFPKPGILFWDIFSLLREPKATKCLKEVMVEYVQKNIVNVDAIVALDSRGFIFGTILSLELGLPFVPIRKPNKLPGQLNRVTYSLEYGTDTFEIQKESIKAGQTILIVDDLLATGGSLAAADKLIRECGGNVAGYFVIMELLALDGRKKLPALVHSLMKF